MQPWRNTEEVRRLSERIEWEWLGGGERGSREKPPVISFVFA
jgi:hypothetical protein